MKHFIKTYCAEIFTALTVVAVLCMVAPFVFNLQNTTGVILLDAGGLCMVVGVFVGVVADAIKTPPEQQNNGTK